VPPQSASDSVPFATASLQLGVVHTPLSQIPLTQSLAA
jgi:hypothetical protein